MNNNGFSAILIIFAIAALSAVLVFVFKIPQKAPKVGQLVSRVSGPRFNRGGSDCPQGAIFTTMPVDQSKILSVTPLGNLNPPDHTIPTDHIYLVVKNNNEIHLEFATAVFAPSDLTITRITHTTTKKSGKEFSNDYSIDFSPCKDIQAKFGHVTKISEKLQSLLEKNKPSCQTQHPRPEDEYIYCNVELNEKILTGEEIGEAGGGTATGLDFWAIDLRADELVAANPKRYSSYQLHTVCPVDLFEKSQKDILSSKFGRNEKKRTVEPLCGQLNQDIIGSAQGNWTTAEGYIDMPEAWSKTLSLVHDNVDPGIGMVAIGGTITSPTKIQFTPASVGTINREFSQVKPDGKIYCYEGQAISKSSGKQSGMFLIQLTDDRSLKVEYQNGNCQDNSQFNSPTVYQR